MLLEFNQIAGSALETPNDGFSVACVQVYRHLGVRVTYNKRPG